MTPSAAEAAWAVLDCPLQPQGRIVPGAGLAAQRTATALASRGEKALQGF